MVVYDPKKLPYAKLLDVIWAAHDPTTLKRHGNDRGTQYRSGAYYYGEELKKAAEASKARFEAVLKTKGYKGIVTEIVDAPEYYFAEHFISNIWRRTRAAIVGGWAW